MCRLHEGSLIKGKFSRGLEMMKISENIYYLLGLASSDTRSNDDRYEGLGILCYFQVEWELIRLENI